MRCSSGRNRQVEPAEAVVYNDFAIISLVQLYVNQGVAALANQTGKRYICSKCGSEFIVTRGGDGSVQCCQQPMELKT